MPGEQVGAAYVSIGLDDSKLESGLNAAKGKVSSAVGGMGSAIGSALKTGAVAGAAALAGIATVGTKTFMDVESAAADAASKMDLSAIAKQSGKTTEEAFKSVKEHVMSLADELGQLNTNAFDPTKIAQACANLAAGGFDVAAASAKDLSGILAMATATNYDLDASAGLAMSTMNQFGLGVSDLSHISDVYTKACGDSAAGMEDLNYAMQYAGPVAKGAGVSFEEVAANLEVFANNGIKGEKAGSALADAINTLVAPSGASEKALAALGRSVKDVDPRTHDFNNTLKDLKAQADASGRGMAAFVDIFGVRGGLLYGLAGATDKVDGFEASLRNCDGAAESMAKNMLDTLVGSFDAAKGAASSLAYMIGEKLAPSIRSALDWFSSKGVPAIREFITAVSEEDWQGAGELIEKGIRAGFEKLKDLGSNLLEWLKGVDYGAVGSYITDAIKSRWTALKDLGSQLLEWLKGVDWAGVATTITDAIKSGWEALKALGEDLAGWIKGYDWGALAVDIADLIKAGWKKVKDWAKDIIAGLEADWDSWIASNGPAKLGEDLGKAVAEGAKDTGKWIYDKIASWWRSNGSSLGGVIAGAIDFATSAAQAAWDFATSFGNTLLTAGKGTIGASILDVIGNAMNSAWEGAGDSLITRAKEWRDAAEDLFAAESFGATVDFKGIGDNPRHLDGSTIQVGLKFIVDGIGYKVSKFGDQFRLDKQVQGKGGLEWQTVSYHTTLKAAEDAAKITVDAAAEASDTTTEAATESAKTTDKASQGFKSTAEKANALTMGVFETSTAKLLSAAMQGAQAQQQAATATSAAAAMAVDRILIGSQTAANAIQQGAQVAANFATQAGQAVKIGLDASGREIAVIGQVAQQRFTQAGGELYNKVQVAGSGFQSAVQSGANAVNSAASNLAGAASNAASSLANAYASFASHNPYSGNVSPSYQVSRTISFSSSASSSSSSSSSSNPSWWTSAYTSVGGRAKGTETTGPELAVIGEAGREWVIPEKHKRWDLLLAAMRAYGITGMAEGGAAGSAGGADTDPENMKVYFSISGLASMSKQVQKIITNLKDFFRISWAIIKAESSTYWKQINTVITTEATITRDNAWQAAIDIRNTWLATTSEMVTAMAGTWPAMSPYVGELKDSMISAFEEAGSGVNAAIDQMVLNGESSLLTFQTNWGAVWSQLLTDLSNAESEISTAVSEIAAQLQSISVNVSISTYGGGGSYSGGGGGGSGGMDWAFASDSDWLAPTGDWSEYGGGGSSISCGSNCNLGCEAVYNNAVISSTGPLATAGLGVDLMNSGYGGNYASSGSFGSSTWSGLPAIFRARGALIDRGPELSIVGEAGPELILPANITRTIMSLAEMGLGDIRGGQGGAGRLVIEDHSKVDVYLDGKRITDSLMTQVMRKLQLRGAVPAR